MSSIATKTGDTGQTGLAGGLRISKSDLRVEAYGTVDELNSFLGFARSICPQPDIAAWTETIQRTLFRVGAALSTPTEALAATQTITQLDVDFLTALVHQIETTDGILSDWSLPGANTHSAAYEMARTVCRRAERIAVRFTETMGAPRVDSHDSPGAPSQSVPSIEVGSTNVDSHHPGAPSQSVPSIEVGSTDADSHQPTAPLLAVTYLNRLSDLIWLFGRLIEVRAGIDARLRTEDTPGPKFSRAW
jgi:cob(I)alamin adenosyltransferase